MLFSKAISAIATAALFSSAYCMTATEVVNNINILTSQSKALQAPANSISLLSGPLFLIGQGPFPQIVIGFTQIISTVNADISAMQGLNIFSVQADENAILGALTTFVTVHQELLNILIGKAGILNDLPLVGPPVAQVLRTLEGVVDTVALGLIAVCPDVATGLTGQKNALDVTIGQAITAYTPIV